MLRGKFIAVNNYIKKNNLKSISCVPYTRKRRATKPKARRTQITKIRVEINEIGNRKTKKNQ